MALVLALTGAGVIAGAHAYANEYDGRVLPGVTVAGVDLSGLTRGEAIAATEEVAAPDLDRTVTVRWQHQQWTTTPRELGATTNAERLVEAAIEASESASMPALARMRWFGEGLTLDDELAVTPVEEGVRAFIDTVAAELHVPARDAAVQVSGDQFTIVPETQGQVLDTEAGAAALLAALDSGQDAVDLAVHPVLAEKTTADFSQVLLLRQSQHLLELYQDGRLTHSWNVAVGTSGYRTPTGVYEITEKRHMPTWVNPSPNGWGRNMPARIGPGVNNPLGVRALNWNAPAIRFHGTANVNSIGRDASKGCVRLTNDDVVVLYDLVEVGATIVSIA
jgi:hypothetical protein